LNKIVKFIEHNAEEAEEDINTLIEENYRNEKDNLLQTGRMQINQLYNKKMKLVNRETVK